MKKQIFNFILLTIIVFTFFACEGMATLFHGEKPTEPPPPPVTYTVTYNANGASGTPPATQTVYENAVILLPNGDGLSKGTYEFVGWSESPSGDTIIYSIGASITVTRNMVFYAQWFDTNTPKYTVIFARNGATSGDDLPNQTVYSGISITIPNQGSLSYSGKVFGGWNTQATGGGTNYLAGATYRVIADVTLYAKWNSEIQYTVTYHANGATSGTVPTAQTVDPGTVITLPSAGSMTYAGRKFVGWNTQANGNGTNYDAGTEYSVTNNVTLYAKWNPQYTVTYHANGASGGAPSAQTVDSGTVITLPGVENMTYTGRLFDGWNTNSNGTGSSFVEGTSYTVNANVTLYAQWSVIPIVPQGTTLSEKLAYIRNTGGQGIIYDIVINGNEFIGDTTISTQGSNITVIIRSASSDNIRYIQLDNSGFLFTIESNITLKLENIILRGMSNNTRVLVTVQQGGKLVLNSGSKVTMNTNSSANGGGGVYVNGGILEINEGAEIIGNSTKAGTGGGGIWVGSQGTVTISGGLISENTTDTAISSTHRGGGIYITGNSTVTMTGGIISKNSSAIGGGIYVDGSGSRFIKRIAAGKTTCGIIYGSGDFEENNSSRGDGHAIYRSFGTKQKRNSTVGLYDEITTFTEEGWE